MCSFMVRPRSTSSMRWLNVARFFDRAPPASIRPKPASLRPLVGGARQRPRGALQDAGALRGGELAVGGEHQPHHAGDIRARHARAGHAIQGSSGSREAVGGDDVGAGRGDLRLAALVARRTLAARDVDPLARVVEVGDGDDAVPAGRAS